MRKMAPVLVYAFSHLTCAPFSTSCYKSVEKVIAVFIRIKYQYCPQLPLTEFKLQLHVVISAKLANLSNL